MVCIFQDEHRTKLLELMEKQILKNTFFILNFYSFSNKG